MVLTGVHGEVRQGAYAVAAAITGYTVTRERRDLYRLTATITRSTFRLAQTSGLRFVAIVERGEWVWPILEHEVVQTTLTARLGPPEE